MSVSEGTPRAARLMFEEIALWMTVPSSPEAMITAACDLIVDGTDSPSVVDLAGRSPTESGWVIGELVALVLDELDLPPIAPDSQQAQVSGTQAMCRRYLDGAMPARDLAQWAHRHIGHEGTSSLQGLVNLDDDYDIADMADKAENEIEERVAQEVARILNL